MLNVDMKLLLHRYRIGDLTKHEMLKQVVDIYLQCWWTKGKHMEKSNNPN